MYIDRSAEQVVAAERRLVTILASGAAPEARIAPTGGPKIDQVHYGRDI
jgi:hypothetical protein